MKILIGGEEIIHKEVINHFKNRIVAVGGVGYVLKTKMVFVSHKQQPSDKSLEIPFSEIATISGFKFYGIVDTSLKIVLQSGKEERFAVDKTNQLYHILQDIIRKK